MKSSSLALGGLCLAFAAAEAGAAGLERTVPSSRILFEPDAYGEFNLSFVNPDQSGDGGALPATLSPTGSVLPIPGSTGDIFDAYWTLGLGWKNDVGDRLSYAVILDQPFGVDTDYPRGFYAGTQAELDSHELTGILAYDATPGVTLYGGLRAQRVEASAAVPFIGPSAGLPPFSVETDADWGYGWLAGAAYQRPDIALRVTLTFYSGIDHEFETTEFGGITIPGLQDGNTRTEITTPKSANLEFQTGIAADTLLFGSVRWVDWSDFTIAPPSYTAVVGRPLVEYEDDWTTYTLGLGRRFTERLSGTFSVSYEPETDAVLTTLGPYDGKKSATVGLAYDLGRTTISGGVTYGRLGNAVNVLGTDYGDGMLWSAGLRIGRRF